MEKMRRSLGILLVVGLLVLLGSSFSLAEEVKRGKVELTVYNNNLGLVKEERAVNLPEGVSELRVTDVASQIDATSVHFKSLTDSDGCFVLEQNYEYDLIGRNKLLEKYIDKEIILERTEGSTEKIEVEVQKRPIGVTRETSPKKERIRATLLSIKDGMVVRIGDEIFLNPSGRVILPALPEGLITKPTLMWQISNKRGGKHNIELSYLTSGINWKADYTAIAKKDDRFLDLSSWVTINNQSGATYPEAKLKLMAGEVHRVAERERRDVVYKMSAMKAHLRF